MSPVRSNLRYLAVGAALVAALAVGCSKKHGTPFDPDSGHPDGFFAKHGASFSENSGSCMECHGSDLQGGVAKVSCYSASRGDQSCHEAGPGGHGEGWSAPASHGAVAKATPGSASGMAYCKKCHGSDFNGGSSGTTCFGCHGVKAPHPKAPWRSTLTHTTTIADNASVCADCHQKKSGTPGCFNSTLCHGQVANHPDGWDSASKHGAAAKGAPGNMSGLAACKVCHGSGFTGGSSGQSCFPCHGWKAPHGKNGWDGGGSSHRTTNTDNASVCADCHRSASGTAGCYNNTLCHGASAGHPSGWSAGDQHGASAKAAPGSTSGMLYCEGCHGTGLNGGSSGQSCLVNSGCHGWSAPHAKSGWDGGGSSHRTTNSGNANVCAQCHQKSSGTPGCFNSTLCHGASAGHPSGWSAGSQHGASAKAAPGSTSGMLYCEGCHGTGLNGGSSGQSCLVNSGCHGWSAPHAKSGWDGGGSSHRTTNSGNANVCAQCHQQSSGTPGCFNGTLCHGAAANHPSGWSAGNQHGASAKAAPGSTSGMLYCEGCHGSNLNGGSSGQSCLVNSGCHGWSAPHARSGWDGGGSSHRTTNSGNANVCAMCHQSSAGTPGCFNNTLCHGAASNHPSGWSAGSQHGAAAKAAPGSTSGMLYCEGCHGSNLNGGSSGQSCLVNSGCHGWTAPHARNGWDGGGSSHRTTNSGNANVCAMCHQSASGTPGCFNNTLCHGAED